MERARESSSAEAAVARHLDAVNFTDIDAHVVLVAVPDELLQKSVFLLLVRDAVCAAFRNIDVVHRAGRQDCDKRERYNSQKYSL